MVKRNGAATGFDDQGAVECECCCAATELSTCAPRLLILPELSSAVLEKLGTVASRDRGRTVRQEARPPVAEQDRSRDTSAAIGRRHATLREA